jgi:hypothetical protein
MVEREEINEQFYDEWVKLHTDHRRHIYIWLPIQMSLAGLNLALALLPPFDAFNLLSLAALGLMLWSIWRNLRSLEEIPGEIAAVEERRLNWRKSQALLNEMKKQ